MKTKPELIARFDLDEGGAPRFLESGESDRRHYNITLHTKAPSGTESVLYTLDPTYFDPVREVQRSERPDFAEEITSYGDYEIQIATSGSSHNLPNREWLSDALRRGHASELTSNPAILGAIEDIERS